MARAEGAQQVCACAYVYRFDSVDSGGYGLFDSRDVEDESSRACIKCQLDGIAPALIQSNHHHHNQHEQQP